MKRNYLFFWFAVLFLLFTSAQSYAEVYSGSCGESVNWSLDTEIGLLEIMGSGEIAGYSDSDAPWYKYKSNIKECVLENGVTSIGDHAFNGTPWLNNQSDGLIYIGKACYRYKGEMPENTSIIIKEGTTSIGRSAFSDCTGLTSITIPESVTSIEISAFYGCTGLTDVIMGEGVTSIGTKAFANNSNLVSITCYSQTSPEAVLTGNVRCTFYGISKEAILYYPKGSDYSAWAPYFAQMIEMDETDIDTPRTDGGKDTTYDIYDMSGRTVRKAATTTDGLKPGLYIINGRKVLVE